ncbi:hypothetical protein K1T71_007439 [Dendrolimus kikuchii]|uniref:Uncharacterized protein n=1 Tax=Dendrolimus kikuchii TaxID=765133 RepID=A0ACC1D0S6_9NEOP|nr:hypothetical protein K1T71_007439 [Dendrolimus kikuchii]
MKSIIVLVMLTLFVSVSCIHYTFGGRLPGSKLVHKEKIKLEAIPFKKRIKNFFYSNANEMPIQAINCFDFQRSEASVNITEGGIGQTYVNLRMKSQRGYRLDYDIEIYA